MTLHLHRAPRTDQLADALGELLASPLSDPFAQEVVVVPEKGIERWLAQRISHRVGVGPRGGDGVCAGVRFLRPGSLVSMLLDRDHDDVWSPDRLVWPLLATIDASLDEPWCATLARHLGHGLTGDDADLRRDRRYSVARRLAGLFASYAVQRPQLVTDWREGRATDGAGGALADDLTWQAELWRRLVDRVGVEAPDQRHARTVALLEAGGDGLDLPGRLSLFGHTRLPVTEVELLQALAVSRDVHLWLPQPSPAALGVARGRRRHPRPRRRHAARSGSATRCWPRWAATPASCAAPSTSPCSTRWSPQGQRRPPPCSAGSSTTCAPTGRPPPTSGPPAPSTRPTAASRCTPATAPPARSTCCARCWSGCSPTTRRCSPATSW